MKKAIGLLLCVILTVCSIALFGCGSEDLSDSKYVGTWKASTLAIQDESEDLETEWIMTLNGDGTGHFDGDDGPQNITWKPTDKGFKTKGDTKLTFVDDGDNIKTKVIGVYIIFEKQ